MVGHPAGEDSWVRRRPDQDDRRAKLIFPTGRGRQALDAAGDRVAEIEEHRRDLAGPGRFDVMCQTMQTLLDQLSGGPQAAVRS